MRPWVVIAVAGCQFAADPVGGDVMPSASAYRIRGHATSVGLTGATPLSGVKLEAFATSDTITPLASAESAADGGYELTVPGGTVALVQAQASGYFDTYLYPAATLASDTDGLDTVLLGSTTFDLLSSLVDVMQDVTMGWIAVRVVDAANRPLSGASVDAAGIVRYNGPGGLPAPDGTETQGDGTAYVFDTPVGAVPVSVLHVGMPFAQRTLPVRGQSVTLAFIGPGEPRP